MYKTVAKHLLQEKVRMLHKQNMKYEQKKDLKKARYFNLGKGKINFKVGTETKFRIL